MVFALLKLFPNFIMSHIKCANQSDTKHLILSGGSSRTLHKRFPTEEVHFHTTVAMTLGDESVNDASIIPVFTLKFCPYYIAVYVYPVSLIGIVRPQKSK